jgi:hypothetical protein
MIKNGTFRLFTRPSNYVNKKNLKALKDDTEEVERVLKALIKSLENKRLNTPEAYKPLTP